MIKRTIVIVELSAGRYTMVYDDQIQGSRLESVGRPQGGIPIEYGDLESLESAARLLGCTASDLRSIEQQIAQSGNATITILRPKQEIPSTP